MANKRNIEGDRLHRFELSDKNRTVRWVLIVIFLAVAAIAIVFGLMSGLQTPKGWKLIDPASNQLNCSEEFALNYELGTGKTSASVEEKALTILYGQVSEKAWRLFYNEAGATENINGLYALNQHPNAELTVDPQLYAVLQQLEEMDTRALYFGPVYEAYDRVFQSVDEVVAEDNDPTRNPDSKTYVAALAAYAMDPEAILLELRGENRVYLKVSEEYLAYLRENAVSWMLDFGWLRNAFVIDYLAQQLTEGGYTNGYLASVDGFVRNLDKRETNYRFDLYDQGSSRAIMSYQGGISIAFLRSYPMYDENADRYYVFSDGRILAPFVDFSDGQSKTSADQLVSYSKEAGCAELAVAMLPVFSTADLDESLLTELTERKIHSVWFAGKELRYTEVELQLTVPDEAVTPTHIQ
jgi:hypothetical protein